MHYIERGHYVKPVISDKTQRIPNPERFLSRIVCSQVWIVLPLILFKTKSIKINASYAVMSNSDGTVQISVNMGSVT